MPDDNNNVVPLKPKDKKNKPDLSTLPPPPTMPKRRESMADSMLRGVADYVTGDRDMDSVARYSVESSRRAYQDELKTYAVAFARHRIQRNLRIIDLVNYYEDMLSDPVRQVALSNEEIIRIMSNLSNEMKTNNEIILNLVTGAHKIHIDSRSLEISMEATEDQDQGRKKSRERIRAVWGMVETKLAEGKSLPESVLNAMNGNGAANGNGVAYANGTDDEIIDVD